MRQVVATGLPPEPAPFSHAVVSNGMVFTAHLPIRPDGTAETGGATAQAELALSNLKRAVEAAGATLDDVAQVILFLTCLDDKPAIDEVYAAASGPPIRPGRVWWCRNWWFWAPGSRCSRTPRFRSSGDLGAASFTKTPGGAPCSDEDSS